MSYRKELAKELLEADNIHDEIAAFKNIREYYSLIKQGMDDLAAVTPATQNCRVQFSWRDNNWQDSTWGWNSVICLAGERPIEAVERMLYTTGEDVNKHWGRSRKDVEYKNVHVVNYKEYNDMVKATNMD